MKKAPLLIIIVLLSLALGAIFSQPLSTALPAMPSTRSLYQELEELLPGSDFRKSRRAAAHTTADASASIQPWEALPAVVREARLRQNEAFRERLELRSVDFYRRSQLSPEERTRYNAARREWIEKRQPWTGLPVSTGHKPEKYLDQWEFRQSAMKGDRPEFSLHNPWENRRLRLALGETRADLTVTGFDPATTSLHLQHREQTKVLPLSHLGGRGFLPGSTARTDVYAGQRTTFRKFYEKWEEAVTRSEDFQQFQIEFDRIGRALDANLTKLDELVLAPDLTHKHEQIAEVRSEMAVQIADALDLNERVVARMREHPSFTKEDIEEAKMMAVPLALGRYVPYPL